VLVLGGYLLVVMSSANPYLSFKLLAYGTPLLVLLVFSPLAAGRRRAGVAVVSAVVLASASAAAATGTEFAYGVTQSKSSSTFSSLASSVEQLPQSAVISVELDVWDQVWATYYLRDRRLVVERPSAYLAGARNVRDAKLARQTPVVHLLTRDRGGPALWRHGGFALYLRHVTLRPSQPKRPVPGQLAVAAAGS